MSNSRYGLEIEKEALTDVIINISETKTKICSKCGFEGEDVLFRKNRNVCKKCESVKKASYKLKNKDKTLERKRIYKFGSEEEITKYKEDNLSESKKLLLNKKRKCRKCKLVGDLGLFSGHENLCLLCKKENKKQTYLENKEEILKRNKIYRSTKIDNVEYKKCTKCGFEGKFNLFVKNKKLCKECRKQFNKKYSEKNKNILKQKAKLSYSVDKEKDKLCKECGFKGKGSFFIPKKNICKKCYKEYLNALPDKNKKCIKCEFEGEGNFFAKNTNVCKKCIKKYKIEDRKNNSEKIKNRQKKYRQETKEENLKKETRFCNYCKKDGPSDLFIIDKNLCKDCNKALQKKYRSGKKDQTKIYRKKYYNENREKILEHHRKFSKENRKRLTDKKREYTKKNIEKVRESKRKYNREHKEDVLRKQKERNNRRLKVDVCFWLSIALRGRLRAAIKNNAKKGSAVRDLGCLVDYLKTHLENLFKPGMSWNNWGLRKKDTNGFYWEVDHIIPFSTVNLENRNDLLKVCHYSNLRPCWGWANMARNFYNDEEIDFNSPIAKYFSKERKNEE